MDVKPFCLTIWQADEIYKSVIFIVSSGCRNLFIIKGMFWMSIKEIKTILNFFLWIAVVPFDDN